MEQKLGIFSSAETQMERKAQRSPLIPSDVKNNCRFFLVLLSWP